MSDDLVKRLRDDYQKTIELCAEAADAIERKDAALRVALEALTIASRQLSEDHRHVLGGLQWGRGAIAKIKEALND